MMSSSTVLHHPLDAILQLAPKTKNPIAIFDLDATLFNNCPRTLVILSEFAKHYGYMDLASRLSSVHYNDVPYSTFDFLHRLDTSRPVIEQALKYWARHFFTNEYQQYDIPLSGAVNYVKKLHSLGVGIVYLSGRDVPGMLLGCTKSLHDHHFPIGVTGTHLCLKPHFDIPDVEFKISTLERLNMLGTVIGAFDNEPANCNVFSSRWPKAITVFMDTQLAPGAPPLSANIPSIKDFSASSHAAV